MVSLFYFICVSYIYSRISVIRNKMGLLLKFPFRSLNVLTVKRRALLICNDSFMSCFILVDSRYFVKLIFKCNSIFTLMLLSCALWFFFLCVCVVVLFIFIQWQNFCFLSWRFRILFWKRPAICLRKCCK